MSDHFQPREFAFRCGCGIDNVDPVLLDRNLAAMEHDKVKK